MLDMNKKELIIVTGVEWILPNLKQPKFQDDEIPEAQFYEESLFRDVLKVKKKRLDHAW